jgi:hypothetical protein
VAGDPDILLAPDLEAANISPSNSAFSPMLTAPGWSGRARAGDSHQPGDSRALANCQLRSGRARGALRDALNRKN